MALGEGKKSLLEAFLGQYLRGVAEKFLSLESSGDIRKAESAPDKEPAAFPASLSFHNNPGYKARRNRVYFLVINSLS